MSCWTFTVPLPSLLVLQSVDYDRPTTCWCLLCPDLVIHGRDHRLTLPCPSCSALKCPHYPCAACSTLTSLETRPSHHCSHCPSCPSVWSGSSSTPHHPRDFSTMVSLLHPSLTTCLWTPTASSCPLVFEQHAAPPMGLQHRGLTILCCLLCPHFAELRPPHRARLCLSSTPGNPWDFNTMASLLPFRPVLRRTATWQPKHSVAYFEVSCMRSGRARGLL